MERLFGAGILSADWRGIPDLQAGSCQFMLDEGPAKRSCGKLRPELEW